MNRNELEGFSARPAGGYGRRHAVGALAVCMATLSGCGPLAAQSARNGLPFGPGEELTFTGRIGMFGEVGEGVLRVQSAEDVRDRPTYRLEFDFRGRVALARIEDRTQSWIDPDQVAAVRFHKHERFAFSSRTEKVEIFPEERRWSDADGGSGQTPAAPLDELSFLYFVRTLDLHEGARYTFDRHFVSDRNPVHVSVIGRERVKVPAGEFATVIVEMRVRDTRRYDGEGVIRMNLTDDVRHVPIRIESTLPTAGRMVLSLSGPLPALSDAR